VTAPATVVPPLDGVRVLDVSGRIGAYCSKVLADLGADVVKVELPSGDQLRHLPPRAGAGHRGGSSLLFDYYHHNKRGITLDWERSDAASLLGELAADADVVLASPKGEPQRPTGFVEEPPSLSWVPGHLLTCFITPFGLTGPCRAWRATPFTSFAMSGRMHHVGPPDGPPLAMPGQPLYDEAGAWAAALVMAALRRPPDDRPSVVDHSVHQVGAFTRLGQEPYRQHAQVATRRTNFGPPPSGVWRCRDGLVDIAPHAPHHWRIFLELTGRPPALVDPIYEERGMRIQLFDLLTDVVADLMAERGAEEFTAAAQAAGLPCAVLHTAGEFVDEAQVRGRAFFVPAGPEPGAHELPGAPYRSAPPLITYRRPAPRLGEHNEEVYVERLGHPTADVERWRADGLV
jgi:crotonobetainyl-CoA:carnitine CoA-transferase CaiB-like acyl-CoA transferase